MKTFPKQPGERLAYDVDLTDWFQGLSATDFIQSAQVSVPEVVAGPGLPNALQVSLNASFLGTPPTIAKVWIEGGADGAVYKVTVVVNTVEGRIKEVDFLLRVKEI